MTMAGNTVRLTFEGQLAHVVLDRPEQLNAMTGEMTAELTDALRQAESASCRALLITAEGRAFSAGRDISQAEPGTEDGGEVLSRLFNPVIQQVADLRMPTIAAVQGACLGTGLGLALACDVVFVAEDAKVGSPFAKIGAVLDSGAHKAFVQRLGGARALYLIYSGLLISGKEAADWGLVSRSVPPADLQAEARTFAAAVADGPTAAFVESKRLVRQIAERDMSLADVLDAEAAAQSRASRTRDYVEGFTAFLDRRAPTFTGH